MKKIVEQIMDLVEKNTPLADILVYDGQDGDGPDLGEPGAYTREQVAAVWGDDTDGLYPATDWLGQESDWTSMRDMIEDWEIRTALTLGVELWDDEQDHIIYLLTRMAGQHYEAEEVQAVLDRADWDSYYPVVDRDGMLTGGWVYADSDAGGGWRLVDDMAAIMDEDEEV